MTRKPHPVTKSLFLFPHIAVAVLFCGCGLSASVKDAKGDMEATRSHTEDVKREAEEIKRDTASLDENLERVERSAAGIDESTARLNENTERLKREAESAYLDLRQATALAMRTEHLASMESTSEQESKVAEAAKYAMAFEFQLWKGEGPDTPESRLTLFRDAAQEFVRDARKYTQGAIPEAAPSHEKGKNLFALSAVLERVNPAQENALAQRGFERVSLLSLIEESLLWGKKLRAAASVHPSIPAYAKEFLIAESDLVTLLETRATALAAMALSGMSNVAQSGMGGWLERIRIISLRWTPELAEANLIQLEQYAIWLEESVRTLSFLKELPVVVRSDAKLERMLANADVSDLKVRETNPARSRMLARLEDARAGFLAF